MNLDPTQDAGDSCADKIVMESDPHYLALYPSDNKINAKLLEIQNGPPEPELGLNMTKSHPIDEREQRRDQLRFKRSSDDRQPLFHLLHPKPFNRALCRWRVHE
jgi:hypothetical protein